MSHESYEELSRHPFVEDVFLRALKISKELDESSPFSAKVILKRKPTEREYYCLVLGTALAHFLTTVQQLEHSVLYMGNFSPSETMKKYGVTRASHLLWATENFIIRTQTSYDRLLVMVDRLFNLQNQANKISHESIVTNGHIAATEIPAVLKPIRNSIKKYYYDRNTIIHEAPFHNDELRRLEGLSLAAQNIKLSGENIEHLNEDIKYETKQYLAKSKREYTKINNNLCKSTAIAFDAMHKVYKLKLVELKAC